MPDCVNTLFCLSLESKHLLKIQVLWLAGSTGNWRQSFHCLRCLGGYDKSKMAARTWPRCLVKRRNRTRCRSRARTVRSSSYRVPARSSPTNPQLDTLPFKVFRSVISFWKIREFYLKKVLSKKYSYEVEVKLNVEVHN